MSPSLIETNARLVITISGEELKEFINDVMADARIKTESDIKERLVPQKVGSRNMYRKSDVLAVLKGEK